VLFLHAKPAGRDRVLGPPGEITWAAIAVARLGRKKQELSEEGRLEMLRRYSQDGAPEIYLEELPMATADQGSDLVAEYVSIVGLKPEDVFGIYPIVVGRPGRVGQLKGEDTDMALCIAYRDSPEYERARPRYHEYLAELAAAGG
jgi:hypothetical protein